MRTITLIAAHEFITTVRRPAFLLFAFLIPVLFGGISLGAALLGARARQEQRREIYRMVGVVDAAGVLRGGDRLGLTLLEDVGEARKAVADGTIRMYVFIPPDYRATGCIELRLAAAGAPVWAGQAPDPPEGLREWLVESLAEDAVDAATLARLKDPFGPTKTVLLDPETGEPAAVDLVGRSVRFAMAMGFLLVMVISTMMTGAYLLQGLAEEKENRVMEMILCAVQPDHLMAGKLIGLGAAGLVQVAIWFVAGGVGTVALGVTLLWEPAALVLFAVLFVLGYALYGTLLLGTGSLGGNLREVTQWSAVWTIPSVLPIGLVELLAADPSGVAARVFSYVPLTAAPTAVLRHAVEPLPAWEIALIVGILGVSTWLALRAAAKVYRVGLLLYGQRPTPRQIWRWLRA